MPFGESDRLSGVFEGHAAADAEDGFSPLDKSGRQAGGAGDVFEFLLFLVGEQSHQSGFAPAHGHLPREDSPV
jgi:hypothetical protein